ncbi:DENN domain-containing protein 10-like [Tubulanus polymorphus]|uniref:DENN domain-containing protein 10-like n=1 Tax=Tubulanus polymorphus TaxID=672921 RepID=UPI003DA494B6
MAKDFHPEKYEHVLRIMISEYQNSGSPVSMMQCYLDIITKGSTKSTVDEDICNVKDYSVSDAYLHYSIKDAIKKFGLETIIIYTAILLKKKVIVYHSKQEELQTFLRTLPLLVWHRHNWDILLPNVDLNENEINDLKTNGHYIAGFTDPAVENRMDLYDVFVNLQALEITTASHAKESMTMGKLHKEIALNMVQCTDNDDIGPKQAVKEISNKTKELLNNLHKLATVGDDGKARLSLETLKEQKFPHATENFLYNLAAAEGFVQL